MSLSWPLGKRRRIKIPLGEEGNPDDEIRTPQLRERERGTYGRTEEEPQNVTDSTQSVAVVVAAFRALFVENCPHNAAVLAR